MTLDAKTKIYDLVHIHGLDFDLAFEMLEKSWPEDKFWNRELDSKSENMEK